MLEFISYKALQKDYKTSWDIPYVKLLNTIEWRNFRQKIIERDNGRCMKCNKLQNEKVGSDYFREPNKQEIIENSKESFFDVLGDGSFMLKMKNAEIVGVPIVSPTILHVHHLYYIFGHAPWEYDNKILLTVCHDCHIKIHEHEKITVYADDNLKDKLKLTPCNRCNGTGFLEQYLYYQNGICFRCAGRKFEEFIH